MQLLIHVFIVDQLLCEIVLSKINSALIGNDCIYCSFICTDLFYCIVSELKENSITFAASHSRLTQKASMYHRGNRVPGWSVYGGGGGGVARQMQAERHCQLSYLPQSN